MEAALHDAFVDAGIVFTGEVTAIDREPGTVTIHWHIEQGIKGLSSSSTFAQREWSGMWSADGARYVVGERALVLLHAPSVAGYAAPVADGVIPLRGTPGNSTVDLRWIAQHIAVTDSARLTPMRALQLAHGSFTAAAALQAGSTARPNAAEPPTALGTLQPASSANSDAYTHVDGGVIFDMLHAWQRTSGAAQ